MPQRFKEKIVGAQVLYDTIAPHLDEMPPLAAHHEALGGALAEARELEARQVQAKAILREVNERRLQLAARTDDLRRRLRIGLKAIFGPQSTRLLEFGVRPLPTTHRRRRLTPAQKAARAAERAVAKAATLAAAEAAAAAAGTAPETAAIEAAPAPEPPVN